MKCKIILVLLLFLNLMAAIPDGEQLLNDLIEHMNPESAKGIMKQTIVTTSGDQRTLTYKTFASNNGENSIMRYIEPARVRGNALMMKNYSDDIWMYNKRTRRVRKLASHAKKQKFEGSDFTYEDMGAGDSWKEDYTPENTGQEKYNGLDCNILRLTAKNDGVSYSKIIAYLRVQDNFPLKIEYYEEDNDLLKILYLKDIEKIQGIPTAMKMVMENQHDNTKTTMEYETVEYNVEFQNDFFTERNLKK